MPSRTVNLTAHHASFIAAGVETGRYSDASEAIRQGLSLLEQRETEDAATLDSLRSELQKGIDDADRGAVVSLPGEGDIRRHLRSLRRTA